MASQAHNTSEFCEDPDKLWFIAKHSVSMKSDDRCHIGSWVFATTTSTSAVHGGLLSDNPVTDTTVCGRIVKLLVPTEHAVNGIAVIVVYQMLEERHPIFGMPRLTKATADGNCLVIVSTKVQVIFPRIHRIRP